MKTINNRLQLIENIIEPFVCMIFIFMIFEKFNFRHLRYFVLFLLVGRRFLRHDIFYLL